jgi:UDP-GlcNAc3NAcA epimerase
MTPPLRIFTVVGARPQFIKAAPVSAAIAASGDCHEILAHTGQHFDESMSEVFFRELGMGAPAVNLDVHGGSHGDMTGRMLAALEQQLLAQQPDWVLVYGDTNSTLAGALAAAKLHIPIAHVEAGLRSFNRRMPEEINRVLTDHVSDVLLCPTSQAVTNLAREGIASGVHVVGDVMYDAALAAVARARTESTILERFGLEPDTYAVATLHRAENVDSADTLSEMLAYLIVEAGRQQIVFPVHPRTAAAMKRFGLDAGPLRVCPPLGYLDMTQLVASCTTVFTDSGGLQKEAYFHRKPCVTMRNETEWVETIACGWNRLWRTPSYGERRAIADYGDGRAAQRIVEILRDQSRDTGRGGERQ